MTDCSALQHQALFLGGKSMDYLDKALDLLAGLSFDQFTRLAILDVAVAVFAFGGMFMINYMDKRH